MLSNEHLIKILKQKLKQTYKIYWSCYDWKHEGLKPLICILEDIYHNIKCRKWIKSRMHLLKKANQHLIDFQ